MTATVISDAEYRLPGWADEVRRPTPDTVEYWKTIDLIACSEGDQRVEVGLVQKGPDAPLQLLVGETRYTLGEAADLLSDVVWAIRIMQHVVLEHLVGLSES